jgi:hypothetical protein
MLFNIKALAAAAGIMSGGLLLLVGVVNLMFPEYGVAMLQFADSLYPGYTAQAGFGSVIVVTLYALVDGAICGAIFGWLYNMIAGRLTAAT